MTHSYVAELELLITGTLLPVFDSYYREKGLLPPYTTINPELLKDLKKRRRVPVLLQAKKSWLETI